MLKLPKIELNPSLSKSLFTGAAALTVASAAFGQAILFDSTRTESLATGANSMLGNSYNDPSQRYYTIANLIPGFSGTLSSVSANFSPEVYTGTNEAFIRSGYMSILLWGETVTTGAMGANPDRIIPGLSVDTVEEIFDYNASGGNPTYKAKVNTPNVDMSLYKSISLVHTYDENIGLQSQILSKSYEGSAASLDHSRFKVNFNGTFDLRNINQMPGVLPSTRYTSLKLEVVPEPSALLALGAGFGALASMRRKKA